MRVLLVRVRGTAVTSRRRTLAAAGLAALLAAGLGLVLLKTISLGRAGLIAGVVWQVDNATVGIRGRWHELGGRELLVQWTVVDDIAFVPGLGGTAAPQLPDWSRIAKEPWAGEVILGLAGRFNEAEARARIEDLAAQSQRLARLPTPLNVVGWYFPVEIDPTWADAPRMAPLLAQLLRPLWVSVYDNSNTGPEALADWLQTWLPADVGVLFQDGVGLHTRDAPTARRYADVLSAQLGMARLRIIAEAFRPAANSGFRAATATELAPQIVAYQGYRVYLFDGPHYVEDSLVRELKATFAGAMDVRAGR